jgi:hypothetical protein
MRRTDSSKARGAGSPAAGPVAIVRGLLIGLIVVCGCGGPPQVGADNYRLIDSLRTAVSARRSDWVEDNANLIAQRHTAGKMNDEIWAAFQAIVDLARGGNWAAAESDVIRLAKAQRATREELEQKKSPQASHHKH